MDVFIFGCYNPYSIQKNLHLLLYGYIHSILNQNMYNLYPFDILNCCSDFCYDLRCVEERKN